MRGSITRRAARDSGSVVHLASYGGPYAGSFIPMLAAAGRAAGARGYDTTFCFWEQARGREWLPMLEPLGEVVFLGDLGTRSVRRLISSHQAQSPRPTIVHSHFGGFDEAAALASIGLRRTSVVWHWQSGNPRPVRWRSRLHGALFGRLIAAGIAVSPEVYEQASARAFPERKLRLFDNAVDLARFAPISESERRAARHGLGLAQDAKVVLHFGWDWERKGGDLLLSAARALSSLPDVTFLTVVTEGDPSVPLAEIEQLPAVRVLAPQGDVSQLYAAADVFLSCSRVEGMPFAMLEALAQGLPVVGTDLPVQQELLGGLSGGRVVASNPGEIARAIEELLALDRSTLDGHALAARARIENSYSVSSWSERLVDLYDEIVARRSG